MNNRIDIFTKKKIRSSLLYNDINILIYRKCKILNII